MDLDFTRTFKRKYKKKTQEDRNEVDKALDLLVKDPHHPGLHTSKVQGTRTVFECYTDKSYRITFEYGNNCIILRNNCKHDITKLNP